jgi:hypothetical protein
LCGDGKYRICTFQIASLPAEVSSLPENCNPNEAPFMGISPIKTISIHRSEAAPKRYKPLYLFSIYTLHPKKSKKYLTSIPIPDYLSRKIT